MPGCPGAETGRGRLVPALAQGPGRADPGKACLPELWHRRGVATARSSPGRAGGRLTADPPSSLPPVPRGCLPLVNPSGSQAVSESGRRSLKGSVCLDTRQREGQTRGLR